MSEASAKPKWSFSSIKTFQQCPRKYYHLKVVRDISEPETDEMRYGTVFHEAAEHYVMNDTPLPEAFKFAKSALDGLKNRPGRKLCEYEMGLTANLEPCGFSDPRVWWRGIADLIIIEDDVARVLDYKTGKSAKYADAGQLELMALAVFKHFPEVAKVKAGLLFVVAKAFPKEDFSKSDEQKLWAKWLQEYGRMEVAYRSNVWNPKTSGLCKKHCPVLSCHHNGRSS